MLDMIKKLREKSFVLLSVYLCCATHRVEGRGYLVGCLD